ncbi:MAG: 16S rRNA (guanine(966)-N(2))-methyltransferase RsmD [Candidatus Binatia bacterium]
MRVISGQAKGQRIKVPKGRALRPTADRVKEAIFNILPHDLSGLRVLDLFAGTGNLSIEALSRGATEAWLVDASPISARVVRDNLAKTGFLPKAKIWKSPVAAAIRRLSSRGEKFDLIFVDPPYETGQIGRVVRLVAREGLLREDGVLVAEHSVREAAEEGCDALPLRDRRRYGGTMVSFFSRIPDRA